MTKPIPFNLNSNISVRLTDKGRRIFREYWAPSEVELPPEKDGWSQFQMWEAMAIFGPHFQMGQIEYPFDLNILIHP